MPSVVVEHFVGRAGEFHARDLPPDGDVHIWWFVPDEDAIVLGSAQDDTLVDRGVCRRLGVDVVRRRSGGGLVLLGEGTLWLDVVLPADHPLWDRDVTSSAFWLGETWMMALRECGSPDLVQHRSRLVRSPESDLVCFAGRGPGEVFLSTGADGDAGAKVVGISQRRTRSQARFQSVVSLHWEPERLIELLADSVPDRARLLSSIRESGSSLDIDRNRLVEVTTSRLVDVLS